jgi:hypothetical protein
VEVRFKGSIMHNIRNPLQSQEQCWCHGRAVDENDKIRGRIGEAIRRILINGKK